MNWLIPYFVFTMSFLPQSSIDGETVLKNQFQSDAMIGVELFDVVDINGLFVTDMSKSENTIGFAPYQQKYVFDISLNWNGFSIGYSHECNHPVKSGVNMPENLGGGERLYIQYDSRRTK